MKRGNKGLSPVVAAIILIVMIVAVAIAVAAYVGALTFTFMKTSTPLEDITGQAVDFTDNLLNETDALKKLNVTIVKAKTYTTECSYWLTIWDFDIFLAKIREYNVSFVVVWFDVEPLPKVLEENMTYITGIHYFWFYEDLPNVGKTAITYPGTDYAKLKNTA